MRLVPVLALLVPWLLFEPGMHDLRPEKAVIAVLAAFACLALVPLSMADAKLRPALALIGVVLVLSNFAFPDHLAVMVSHMVAGAVLMLCGMPRRPVITFSEEPPVSASASALLPDQQPHPA